MSSEKCSTYELICKGYTPSGRAIELSPIQHHPRVSSFLVPKQRVRIIDEAYRQVGQVMRCHVMKIEMPDALASFNGLNPETDSIARSE
ncbi:hypothetical protein [Roseinatronobacter sp. NSM]|uniref:hypothetical protein n=1 Tax=Roseinatronobacter sp. NSM TaxID=3457785 RepID=UPI0040352A50